MKEKRKNRGITLIALVVTIIILIILAGISANILLSNGGILQRAKEQKEEQKKQQILEELELAKGPITIEGDGYTSLEKYLEEIRDKKLANTYEVTSVEQIDEANAIIWVDRKYKYKVAQIGIDVIINAEGYIGRLEPEIKTFNIIGKTSNSIRVEVEGILAKKYEFYIGEDRSNYEKVGEVETNKGSTNEKQVIEYTYENLITTSEGKNYCLKVIAKNKVGVAEREIEEETDIIPVPRIEVANASEWTNGTKRVSIKEEEGYRIKYTTNETIPSAVNGTEYRGEFEVEKNCIITAVYLDSTNQIGSIATNEITRIDKKAPQGEIIIDKITTNSIKITMNVKDEVATKENGCSGIKGYYYSKGGEEYTEITKNTSYEFIELSQTKDYEIKVKVVDNAGNEIVLSKRESTTTVPIPTITVENELSWSNTNKKVSINQTEGYTIKYTTNGSVPSASNGTTYTGSFEVSQNCTIKALYVDNRNQIGSVREKQINKIDKTDPKEAKIEISGSTTQASMPIALSAKVTHEDLESGVNINSCRYVLNTTSTEIGTNTNSYTGGAFSSNGQTITINPSSVANWYLHVLTIDNVGNKKEKISKVINIETNYHKHINGNGSVVTDSTVYTTTNPGGCYIANGHTHNKPSACAYQVVSGEKIYTSGGGVVARDAGCRLCDSGYWVTTCNWRCNYCGATGTENTHTKTSAMVGVSGGVHCGSRTVYKCGSPTNTWIIGCNKNSSTIDGYNVTY